MLGLTIHLDGDRLIEDLADREIIHLGNDAQPIRIGALDGGMASGRTSVAFGFELPGGQVVLAETSLRLFLVAADALRARYGDE